MKASIQTDALFGFALLGARASSFHHDLAAKLQGLMMALDEIGDELETGKHGSPREDPSVDGSFATRTSSSSARSYGLVSGGSLASLVDASSTARAALDELIALLSSNRALARDARTALGLREAVAAASARANVVVRGDVPAIKLMVVAPAFIQALAMLFASTGKNRRGSGGVIELRVDGDELSFASGPDGTAGTELAIAAWALARDGGELRCGRELVVRLPPRL
ncbi:MAG: hypothetical protein KF773_01460 [Deltaproteobacteria bacterium]|nr:hypothetical protein [Deltaproteobacteria bacterium]